MTSVTGFNILRAALNEQAENEVKKLPMRLQRFYHRYIEFLCNYPPFLALKATTRQIVTHDEVCYIGFPQYNSYIFLDMKILPSNQIDIGIHTIWYSNDKEPDGAFQEMLKNSIVDCQEMAGFKFELLERPNLD